VGIFYSIYYSIVHNFCFNIKKFMFIVFIFLIHVAMYMEMLNIFLDNIKFHILKLSQNNKCILS
jgi:hypothetical protein